jgi:NADH-quinone oxidoreductase subunit F
LDLHLTDARATPEERNAVDAVLGAPESVLAGHQPKFARHLLLPVLHAIQARTGWISPGALNYASVRLDLPPAETHGVASFYGMFSLSPRPPVVAHVCDDIACLTRGVEELCAELENKLGPPGANCAVGCATWVRSACLGLCERGPAALITAAGALPKARVLAPAQRRSIESSIHDAAQGSLTSEPDVLDVSLSVPQAQQPQLRLLRRIGQADPSSFDDYRRLGGYEALSRAFALGPEGVVREVTESRLLGRGGAAFPTGKKWEALQLQRHLGRTHYVICNADESEPGTFKDRILMEGDPFAVLEGMTIAALAVGAQQGYIYLRGEYPLAGERLAQAIRSARANGLLGDNVLGQGLRFDIELRRGAGAYICGEETALFNSIEGYRGEPRNKPPFPTQAGLFRMPTIVNNVETLINVPEIILAGGATYSRIGTPGSAGYRLFCLSGHVVRPGVYEVSFGATLHQVIELAGGVGGNGRLQAVLLGGAAGVFVSPEELDMPLTFEGTRAMGATLGSGVIMLFDDSVDLKRILLRIAAFFRHETCGQCVPCRVGVVRQDEALHRLVKNQPLESAAQEIGALKEIGQAMRDASICGLGQTASSAVESVLSRWSLFS